MPPQIWPELKAEIQLIRDAANYENGKERLDEFVETYGAEYPPLVKCLIEDVAILNHLKVPIRHRKTVRTTNRAAKRWNRIPMNKLELSQLESLRRKLGIERAVIMEKMDQEFAVRAS